MRRFIEVNSNGQRVLVNLNHVAEVREIDGECLICFAHARTDGIEQDYIKPKESYSFVRELIFSRE